MNESYVEKSGDCYRIRGTRVSLDSLVYGFLEGDSPETIAQSFPVLTLEQVYGALAYYLAHRDQVDAHLRAEDVEFEELRRQARARRPELYKRLDDARRVKEPAIG